MDSEGESISDWLNASPSDPSDVARQYDAWASTYDHDLTAWSYRAPSVVAQIIVTRHPDATSVLDVGCGTGLAGRALRDAGFVGRLHGLDIASSALDVAEQTGVYDSLEQTDLQQRLPLDDESVDAVMCVGVMTYLPNVEAVWREFARVTRRGGLVVATQREDLWPERHCQAVVDRLRDADIWTPDETTGPAPYLPDGYGGTPAVDCYYLTARVL